MTTKTEVYVQHNKIGEGRKSETKRNRPRLNITVSKDVHEWLHEKVPNISDFIDSLVRTVMQNLDPHVVVITPMGASTGRAGSLARQSTGLLIPVSGVQIPSGPCDFR